MIKIKIAILGCTGLVGQQFVRLLEDHPFFTLSCLSASTRSAGKPYGEATAGNGPPACCSRTARMVIREPGAAAVIRSGARIVFSALPASVAGSLESELRSAGLAVFSNASAHRMDPSVPLLVPEVNPGHLELSRVQLRKHAGFIVTNPNCVVAGLAISLQPLIGRGLRAVSVTTFQAVSGGGRRGVASWDILGNVVPFIPGEEEKVGRETRKILGTPAGDHIRSSGLEVYPSCARVPVRDGHLQSVTVELRTPVSVEALVAAFAAFRGEPQRLKLPTAPRQPILVHEGADRPQPALDACAGEPARARGMAVSVGRLRSLGKRFAFFLLVHNTVRGAAGASVLNAELAASQGLIAGVSHG